MIEIQNLHHRFADGTRALSGIDLTVPDGELLLICGPNGSGKTTLIRHINGLLKPSSGRIVVDGLDASLATAEVRRRVGMVFQDADSQIVGETVWEDVAFGPENLGLDSERINARVLSALQMVGLEDHAEKPCHLLSGGEKRRLAIAGVLALEPTIVIFDEPFANLDYTGTRQVLHQIVSLNQQGRTVVVTTHDVEKIIAHVDRIVILQSGQVKVQGSPERVAPELSKHQIRPPCYSILGGRMISWLSD